MVWAGIFRHLKDHGFEVYPLGKHKGECRSPYLVLRDNGIMRNRSIEVAECEVLLYYPEDRYSEFAEYIGSVKLVMNLLFPALRLVEDEQPHYQDTEVKAYTTGLIYRNSRISKVNRIMKG